MSCRKDRQQKALRVMKVIVLLLWAGMMGAHAHTYSQDRLNISVVNADLNTLFQQIHQQSGYRIMYQDDVLRRAADRPVTLNMRNASIQELLDKALKGTGLSYRMAGMQIAIHRQSEVEKELSRAVAAAPIDVSGQVRDEKGEALPGASIRVKGASQATVSDINGSFSLKGVPDNAILVVSFMGFSQQEIAVNGQSRLSILLKEDNQRLSEVVVIGYGTQKRTNVTGAVSSINSKDLAGRPITSVSAGLQGLLPGLTAVSASGFPGSSNASIRVRGIGTTNNSDPFILIDGIPGDMNYLNPDDIESVTVLKDAASSAIYGSRAANGVILVTTKKGSMNKKASITYNGYVGIQKPTALPKMLGSVEYMQMLNEAQVNVGLPPTYTEEQIEVARNGSDPNYFANTNWTEELFKDSAPQYNHALSINGGSQDFGYYLSYGRQDQNGLMTGDQYNADRNNLRARLNSNNILDIIDLDANIGYIDRKQNQPAGGTDGNTGPMYQTLTMSPLNPVRFTNGSWGYGGGSSNPIATATDGGYNNFAAQEFTGNISGTIRPMKNLSLKAQYGVNVINQLRSTFFRKIDYLRPESGALWYTNRNSNELESRDAKSTLENFSAQLNYNFNLNDHHFKFLAGYQQEVYRYDSFAASKTNFVSDDVPVFNLGSANPMVTGDAYQYALQSGFGRFNYDYAEKYLLEVNVRYDGSSRYADDYRFGTFPSASLGWRFTQESFLKDNAAFNWLSEGKIRASYGSLGNQYGANGPAYSEWYPYLNVLTGIATMPIGNVQTTGITQTVLSNPILQWEKVNMLNIGLDMAFFNSRLSLTADWFDKRTKDIQLKVPQPDVLGLIVPDQNAGDVSNKGWELALGWNDRAGEFRYGFTAQLSDVKNEVLNLGGVPPTIADRITQVGYPIDAFYGYRTDGIAQESDFSIDQATGKRVPNFPIFAADAPRVGPGDLKYVDLNGDGVITAGEDRTVIGDAFPRYSYSFRGDFGYKGFDMSFFLQGVAKANGYINGVGMHTFQANGAFPQEVHRDRWTPENTGAWYPRFTYLDTRNTTARISDYWLQDAAYLRLKNVQLGYTLPQALSKKWRAERLRLFASAENLFTKSDFYYGYDPETASSSGGAYPQIKTITFGINLIFQ